MQVDQGLQKFLIFGITCQAPVNIKVVQFQISNFRYIIVQARISSCDLVELKKIAMDFSFVMINRYPGCRCTCCVVTSEKGHGERNMKLLMSESYDQTQHFDPFMVIIGPPTGSFKVCHSIRVHFKRLCHVSKS